MAASAQREPVTLTGRLDEPLSRGLWLVKWLLLIPHFIVLIVLIVLGLLATVAAFFAILVTGRYPRGLFDFNVGVMRWAWRVEFYSYAALGTDRYPPFTLASVPGYPADLEVVYPERLNRGLVLVKWLLAIPHLLIIGIMRGGSNGFQGLVSLLVLISGVSLLFTKRYPRSLFGFVMGMNTWYYRVIPYVLLMTDRYPPFRLDIPGDEPRPQA